MTAVFTIPLWEGQGNYQWFAGINLFAAKEGKGQDDLGAKRTRMAHSPDSAALHPGYVPGNIADLGGHRIYFP
jgi:hypothetical protein